MNFVVAKNRPRKNSKTRAKAPCKCLMCAKSSRETFEGSELLICKDEACDMKCGKCTERPNNACGYKPLEEVSA